MAILRRFFINAVIGFCTCRYRGEQRRKEKKKRVWSHMMLRLNVEKTINGPHIFKVSHSLLTSAQH